MDQLTTCHFQIFEQAHAAQLRAIKNHKRRIKSKTQPPSPCPPANRSARQSRGDGFEHLAYLHLERAGLTLLTRQLACPRGEIDLVLRDLGTLVFVEVRARSRATHGSAAASITRKKQTRLIQTAKWHLPALTRRFFRGLTPACRFDAITFDHGHLQWLRDVIRVEQDK